ncbi:MAG: alpha/beta hydrolase domain-containing protein [Halioglobus sp.]
MTKLSGRSIFAAGLYFVVTFLMGCSDGTNHKISEVPVPAVPNFLPIGSTQISLPPDIGEPLNFGLFDLESVGYEQQEYFIAGTASAFTNTGELLRDGAWDVEAGETAAYTTRVLVRRPVDATDFNGTVLVEWMNVSAGFDVTPEWDNAHVEIIREGYVWVGVTAQYVGIYGREPALAPFHLKAVNEERYEALVHPGDSFSYDIFSQVAEALRNPGNIDMLNGLAEEVLIGAGESQSAFRMTTYVNAIHPLYNPFDGYIVHSRGEYSSALSQDPQVTIETPPEVLIRTDLNVPVLTFQTETDLLRGTLNSVTIRQDDTELLRLWEVAGTAHGDAYSTSGGWQDTGVDPSFAAVVEVSTVQGFIQCSFPMNSGHAHYVFNAALDAVNRWIKDGSEPPTGELLQVSDDLSSFVLDDLGNVLGGIRTPYVDAPVAVLSGLGQVGESFCGLFGTTILFSADQLVTRYIDEAGYVDAVTQAAESAVEAGFILPLDAQQMIDWAPQQWRSQVIE